MPRASAGSSSAPPAARKQGGGRASKSLPQGGLIFVDWATARDSVRLVEPRGHTDACAAVSALLLPTAGSPCRADFQRPALPIMMPVMIVSYDFARMEGDASPIDVRLTPWTEHGVSSAPDTHFVVRRGHLVNFVDGFVSAWRAQPELHERLVDALLYVLRFRARGGKSPHPPVRYVPSFWRTLMGELPLPPRLAEMVRLEEADGVGAGGGGGGGSSGTPQFQVSQSL